MVTKMPSLNGRTGSKSQLASLSETTNWRVGERPLVSPGGQRPGLGRTTQDEKTAEERSKITIKKELDRVQSTPVHT